MDTNIYKYMLTIADTKNITAAAEQLYVSQSALTQHLNNLEKEYGCSLFIRSRTGVVPTPEGEIFLTYARRICKVEEDTEERIHRLKYRSRKIWRVYVDVHLRSDFIDRIWPEFQSLYPGVELSLLSGDTSSALPLLTDMAVDAALIPIFSPLPKMIDYIPLFESAYQLMLPPNHPCAQRFQTDGIVFDMLRSDNILLLQSYSSFSAFQQQLMEEYLPDFPAEQVITAHSMREIAVLINKGAGASFLPGYIARHLVSGCTIVPFHPPIHFRHVLAYHKSDTALEYRTAMAEILHKYYQTFRSS